MHKNFVQFVKQLYNTDDYIPLHQPCFKGNELSYLKECIDTTFVSSVGKFVDSFEAEVANFTGSKYAIATVNGTAALHIAMKLSGVTMGDEVITQSLSFVSASNAIVYCQAEPVYIDIDKETLGLSPDSLEAFLEENCEVREDGICWNKKTNNIIRVCLPMHTFGFPTKIHRIREITKRYNITLIEDAAESLGSLIRGKHTGTIGEIGILSFNGNKIITTGGGGMILTDNKDIAEDAKHLTTTAKLHHKWEFNHDKVGFNYRLPNINAALGLAQMENLNMFINNKRKIARSYQEWGNQNGLQFFIEPNHARSNYWLNVALTENKEARDKMLNFTNEHDIMTRPVWTPMHNLKMFDNCFRDDLTNTELLAERIVNVPSSAHCQT